MHTLEYLDCSFTRCLKTLVDEAPKLQTIRSNEWPDFASYLTETSGVFTRYSARNRRGLEALNQC